MMHFLILKIGHCYLIMACLILALPNTSVFGNDSPTPHGGETDNHHDTASSQKLQQETSKRGNQLNKSLKTFLTEITFRGHFTTDKKGSEEELPKQDEYTITSAILVGGDYWLLTSRIRYRDIDVTLPVPVTIHWSATTPVITLEEVTLPGMGAFSARVLLHKNQYAGTWQHDDVGGHLFGTLSKNESFSDIFTK
jgi:hypothetical protein